LRHGSGTADLLGYARVSTTEQNPDLQVDGLTLAGCWKVWTDHASGRTSADGEHTIVVIMVLTCGNAESA